MKKINPHSTRYIPSYDEGLDFYFDEMGMVVLTKEYHKKRGYCCKSGCKECPWGFSIEQSRVHAGTIIKQITKNR